MLAPRIAAPDGPCASPRSHPEALATTVAVRHRIDSQALLGAAQEVEIVHGADVYRLRRTALGKLILTK
jgi:hemin uptake protein HemP